MYKDLDEAIQHFKSEAEDEKERAYTDYDCFDEQGMVQSRRCLEFSENYSQVADWLSELQKLKDNTFSIRELEILIYSVVCYKSKLFPETPEPKACQDLKCRLVNMREDMLYEEHLKAEDKKV